MSLLTYFRISELTVTQLENSERIFGKRILNVAENGSVWIHKSQFLK